MSQPNAKSRDPGVAPYRNGANHHSPFAGYNNGNITNKGPADACGNQLSLGNGMQTAGQAFMSKMIAQVVPIM